MDKQALIAERARLIEQSDLARGFAAMAKGTAKHNFTRAARECSQAAMLIDDWLNGAPSSDVENMSEEAILAALAA